MRARIVFIALLVLILLFAFWPTAISMGAAGIAQLFGCETDFNRAIPCTIDGEEWGQSVYDWQKVAYLSLFTISWAKSSSPFGWSRFWSSSPSASSAAGKLRRKADLQC
jgi:hypothetical protein